MIEEFDDKVFITTLLNIPKVSRKTVYQLIKYGLIKSLEEEHIQDMFSQTNSRNKRIIIPTLEEIRFAKQKAYKNIELTKANGINIITILDNDFPNKLSTIEDPPVIIYYKGNKECLNISKSVAIIGTRNPTVHGTKIANRLGYLFGKDGFVVVSGLANGCDEFGHTGCVEAHGKSIAVLPGGLDKIYPASNKVLAQRILEEDGCLISEYPIGTRPFRSFFVDRDRLQSALSECIIVIETDIKGGTMHTVGFAKKQNKIIACYKHSEKYKNEKQAQGNIMLLNNGIAMPISNPYEIEYLKNKVIHRINEYTYKPLELENKEYVKQITLI